MLNEKDVGGFQSGAKVRVAISDVVTLKVNECLNPVKKLLAGFRAGLYGSMNFIAIGLQNSRLCSGSEAAV